MWLNIDVVRISCTEEKNGSGSVFLPDDCIKMNLNSPSQFLCCKGDKIFELTMTTNRTVARLS